MDLENRKHIGEIGEAIAAKYLKQKDYRILDRNFFHKYAQGPLIGEVDLVAMPKSGFLEYLGVEKSPITFVEVKTVYGNNGFSPESKVNAKKKEKIAKMAEIWLQKKKIGLDRPWQIDVIAIVIDSKGKKAKINHFRNI
ncbi:YraN family protein [Candidatus Parcubacteria bacterium]|nr:YraN family protein [Candidatus Parcubacteria bacterium]